MLALHALLDIWRKDKKPKDALDRHGTALDSRDRAFLHELVYGVVRNRIYIDWCLKPYLKDPAGLGPGTLNNLRLGVYQALFMRVPDRAVVFETTEVEKAAGKNTRLVNAVLRRIVKEKNCPEPPEDPVERISIVASHPRWLVRRWVGRFGAADAEALASANNMVPPLTLRVNTLRRDREEIAALLTERGVEFRYSEYSPVGLRLQDGHVFSDIEDLLGEVFIQDEAAQLVTCLLQPRAGQRILDACAAPGGKTTHIAELTGDRAVIHALDSSEERLRTLEENLGRQGIRSVETACADIRDFRPPSGFHRILLDAPCSALGVIRRNPDARYRCSPAALKGHHQRQLDMLLSAGRHLLRGGILVYAVCSTEPEEGEEVIRAFLHKEPDFFIIDSTAGQPRVTNEPDPVVRRLKNLFNEEGFFRTYPHKHDMDGFFAARLSRR